ncbi:MAG: hypothetical protein HDS69_06430 [Bacteroidales bacterium]|nr:hypothetical protein [Bacteroidales bacterium]
MKRDRILLVKKPGYDHLISSYHNLLKIFNELVSIMKQRGINPTMQTIESLIRGDNISYVMTEINQEYISEKVGEIMAILHNQPIELSHFLYVNGKVILSPEYIKHAEKIYCIFVDSPGKFKVYDAWKAFVNAKQRLDEVVKATAKRSSNPTEEHIRLYGKNLIGVAAPGNFSIGKILYDGELVLNGENFDWFQ